MLFIILWVRESHFIVSSKVWSWFTFLKHFSAFIHAVCIDVYGTSVVGGGRRTTLGGVSFPLYHTMWVWRFTLKSWDLVSSIFLLNMVILPAPFFPFLNDWVESRKNDIVRFCFKWIGKEATNHHLAFGKIISPLSPIHLPIALTSHFPKILTHS